MINFFEQHDPASILKTLKTKIYGKQNDKKIDSIDATLERISNNILNKNTKNYGEIVQKMMSNSITSEDIKDITSDITTDIENQNRITRYMNAEEICDSIPYCERALQVLVDGIVSPDDITKKSLQVLEGGVGGGDDSISGKSVQVTEIRNIIEKMKLEDLISDIVYGTLKLGDHFIEICDYNTNDVPVTQSVLAEKTEKVINSDYCENDEYRTKLDDGPLPTVTIESYMDHDSETNEYNLNEQYESYNTSTRTITRTFDVNIELTEDDTNQVENLDVDVDDKKKTVNIEHVRIIQHDPKCVIKLQSKRYKMPLGYLVLPEVSSFGGQYSGTNMNQYGISNTTPIGLGGGFGNALSSLYPGAKNVTGIDGVYQALMTKIKKYVKDSEISVDKREVLILLMRTIRELEQDVDGINNNKESMNINIRFVPTIRMQHFKIPSQRFFPYGESIFYKSTFQGKLLIALETAVTMKRISDSIEKRIMYVETSMNREGKNLVEDLKMKFKKRKFNLDGTGTISTIPSQISTSEDIYIPQTKGRRFIEFDTLNSSTDIRNATEELKYVRDTLISGLQVPPAYINLEENLSNKAALAFENALFAQTIVSYQHTLSQDLQDMVNKLFSFMKGEKIKDGVIITFSPPKMLQMERDVEKYEMCSRIVNTLVEMGAPREWAVKTFVDVDWNEVESSEPDAKLSDLEKPPEDDGSGGMGGFGGGVGVGGMGGNMGSGF
jgi:hypothetical protein